MKAPVVVLDATGGLGRGVVHAALASGRPVIAVAEDPTPLRAVREQGAAGDLTLVTGVVLDERTAAALATKLRELDRPIAGIVVAACGEPARGRVLDQPAAVLQRRLEAELLPQLAAARQLLPLLAQSGRTGSYVVVGSPGSENPWAGYGFRSVAAAAVSMLVRVLHDEARALGVRVQLLAISRPACTDDNRTDACAGWPSAASIGERALALIDHAESRTAASAVVHYASEPPAPRRSTDSTDQRLLEQAWDKLEPLIGASRRGGRTP